MRVFVFGAGFSGQAFAKEIAGTAEFVGGTTRSREKAPALARCSMKPFLFEGNALSAEIASALSSVSHLVISIAPGEDSDPAFLAARETILCSMPALEWIGYLSTVGVYGDHGCAWVNEESECRPVSRRSAARLQAEERWLGLGRERGCPLAILRLSGIYGPGRNAFVNLERGTARRIIKPGQVFNRIHVDDIAGALLHLAQGRIGGIFNVSDDKPSPPQDVVEHAARLMGIEPPPEVPFESAGLSPMARSFYDECKRVANGRIKAAGYRFRYPDYIAALDDMWRRGAWRGQA
ncbi:nucleoside-diphosphate-sugar epimerase [Mesorhizobium sp. J18]|nr:nucleoside-diphosphate-sugar epimerase [Mesorhizobium sp. J18]